jgi:hypothetical protein
MIDLGEMMQLLPESPQTSTPFDLPSLRHFFIFHFGNLHLHSSLRLCSPITSEHTVFMIINATRLQV